MSPRKTGTYERTAHRAPALDAAVERDAPPAHAWRPRFVEITGKKRDRSWAYQSYLDRLRVGTDLESAPGR